MTKVVHCKKDKFDVYIGRPSKWGNPFTHIKDKNTIAKYIVDTREDAITNYKGYLWKEIVNGRVTKEELLALDGKTLGCWCKPLPCHGDVIAQAIEYFKNEEKQNHEQVLE